MPRRSAATSDGKARPNIEEPEIETSQTVAAGQLRTFVERVENLLAERATIAEDIAQVYAEMKGTGFDTKMVRKLVQLRKMDAAQRQEEESILDLYKAALGMA